PSKPPPTAAGARSPCHNNKKGAAPWPRPVALTGEAVSRLSRSRGRRGPAFGRKASAGRRGGASLGVLDRRQDVLGHDPRRGVRVGGPLGLILIHLRQMLGEVVGQLPALEV